MEKYRIIFFTLLLLVFVGNANAIIYKWVDETGRVHFGDKPFNEKQSKLTEESVISFIEQLESASKKKNWNKLSPFFFNNAKFVFDLPADQGGRLKFGLQAYQRVLQKIWEIPGTYKAKTESREITITENGNVATINDVTLETIIQSGNPSVSTRSKSKFIIKSYSGAPKISSVYIKPLK